MTALESGFQLTYGLWLWMLSIGNTFIQREKSPSVHNGLDFGMITLIPVYFAGIMGLSSVKTMRNNISIAKKYSNAHLMLTILSNPMCMIHFVLEATHAKTQNESYIIKCCMIAFIFGINAIFCSIIALKWKNSLYSSSHKNKHTDINSRLHCQCNTNKPSLSLFCGLLLTFVNVSLHFLQYPNIYYMPSFSQSNIISMLSSIDAYSGEKITFKIKSMFFYRKYELDGGCRLHYIELPVISH